MSTSVDQTSRRPLWFTHYAPVMLWIGVILFLSSPQGSMTQTSRFIGPLLEFLFPSASPEQILIFHGYIRKCAHFTEYGILGFLGFRAFSVATSSLLASHWLLFASLLIGSVAVIDEFNQSFEPSRTSSPWDVALDVAGGVFVLSICYLWQRSKGSR